MKQRRTFAACTVVALVAGSACIMPDQISQIQKDVADVRLQLRRIEGEQATARTRMEELGRQTTAQGESVSPRDIADLSLRLDQTARESAAANQRLLDLSQRFERFSQELDRRRNEVGSSRAPSVSPPADRGSAFPPDAAPRIAAGGADELYNTAYADFSKGNYDLAIEGFEEFQQAYPDHSQADNALYWVGECLFSQGKYAQAIQAFDRLLEMYPASDKAPSGDLKKALAFLEQNQVSQAIVQLQHVRNTYVGTDEARVARERLTALGIPI